MQTIYNLVETETLHSQTSITLEISPEVRQRLKIGYAARLLPLTRYSYAALAPAQVPQVGDLILARVKRLGRHNKIDDCYGRKTQLFEEDLIVAVYGNRYATDQFEGLVPENTKVCHLLSIAAVCGEVKSRHVAMNQPTELEVIGFLYDKQHNQLNLRNFGQSLVRQPVQNVRHRPSHQPKLIVVVGASMNSGKTTTAASLIRGLSRDGYKVAAGKVTGTACGNDVWSYQDNGAVKVLDFSDFGFPSTYLCSELELMQLFRTIYHNLADTNPDYIVLEIADGIVQRETEFILANREFKDSINHLIYASGDSLAAEAGVRWLNQRDYSVLAVSGLVTASPLALREAEKLTGLPCYTREEIIAGKLNAFLAQANHCALAVASH
jgi:molybdopterin-guanine dinucleotide biosynthesis protein